MDDNVQEVIPFFRVADMERSVRFYVEGLGFTISHRWVVEGKLKWCCMSLGGASVMLQEGRLALKPGEGVSLEFICRDALEIYHEVLAKGLSPSEPFVGNNMWCTTVRDPDGYVLEFESPTEVPEETQYSEWEGRRKP